MKGAGFLDMRGTSAMGMPWRLRRCLFSLGQGIASNVGEGSLQPPCSRSLVDGTPKTGVWSPLLCLKTGATEHINRGHARSDIEFQSNGSIADTSQIETVIVTCCCYQMDLPARSCASHKNWTTMHQHPTQNRSFIGWDRLLKQIKRIQFA